MRLNLERKIILITALFGLGSLIIVGLIIIPTISNIRKLDEETYTLRLALERKYQHSLNIRSSLQQIAKIKREVIIFPEHLLGSGQELQFITLLESLATKNAVAQKVMSSNLDSNHSQQITMTLAVVGDYQNVLRYLSDLESTPYFITITRLYVTPLLDRTNPNAVPQSMSMNIDLRIYVTP